MQSKQDLIQHFSIFLKTKSYLEMKKSVLLLYKIIKFSKLCQLFSITNLQLVYIARKGIKIIFQLLYQKRSNRIDVLVPELIFPDDNFVLEILQKIIILFIGKVFSEKGIFYFFMLE